MTTLSGWSPPVGATLIEPGVWEAPSGLYVEPSVWAEWEARRDAANRAYAEQSRREAVMALPPSIEDCEAQIHALACANAELAGELDEAYGRLAFVEDLLAAVLAER